MQDIRIGHGYDVHKLVKDRDLILGGVKIPFELGLLGHSDADVLIHSVMDAIFGAMGEGDIGRHFPDTDDKYKGISSMILAKYCYDEMIKKGYYIGNIDVTVIAQKPKLAPFIKEMEANLAMVFGIDLDKINIKATTEEHLGFTGRLEGISCHAVTILKKD